MAEDNYTTKYYDLEEIEETPIETLPEDSSPTANYTAKYFTDSSIVPETPTDEDPSFFETLGQTVDQLQASGWAGVRVMGEAMGNETLVEAGNKGVIFNEAQAAKYGRPMIIEDIEDTGDAMNWLKGASAQVIPSIAVSLPTAFAGAKTFAALGTAIAPGPGTLIGGVIGGALGAFLPSAFLSTGEIDREMKARAGEDYSDPLAAMGGGAVVGALDTAALAIGLKGVLPHILKRTGGGRATMDELINKMVEDGVSTSVAKRAVFQGLVTAAAEGSTEAAQELTQDYVAELSTGVSSSEEELSSTLINAFALGVVGGGPLGTVSGASVQRSRNERATNEKILQEEETEFQKELDTWTEDQGLQEKTLPELRQYALDNNIKIVESDLTGIENEDQQVTTAIDIIRNAEERKRTELKANQLMEEAGLVEKSLQDRVDDELGILNVLSEEELLEEAQRQGLNEQVAEIKNPEDIRIFLANNKVRAQFQESGESKVGMDSFSFRKYLQNLSSNYTRDELLVMAKELNIPVEDIEGLSQFELASRIGKLNAITEMNNSNLEAVGDQTKTIELTVQPDRDSQTRVEKEIEKGRVIEFTAGNNTFTSSIEGEQLVYRNERGETFLEFNSRSQDADIEKGLPITNVTLRKGRIGKYWWQGLRNQQDDFVSRFFSSLKGGSFGFSPSGPLGFEAFVADRDRIGRLRAINKTAQNLAYQYEESKLAALQNGEIANEQEADQLILDYLSKAQTTVELDVFNKALKEKQIADLEKKLDKANDNQKGSIQNEIELLKKDVAANRDTVEKVRSLDQLPVGMKDFATKARGLVDTLSNRLLKELPDNVLNEQLLSGKTRKETIEENLGKYLTQSFKIYEPDLGYNPVSFWNKLGLTEGSRAAKQKVDAAKEKYKLLNATTYLVQEGDTLQSVAENKRTTVEEIQKLNTSFQPGTELKIPASEAQADEFIKSLLENKQEGFAGNEIKVMAGLQPGQTEKAQLEIETGVLQERVKIPKEYKELMGEITNPAQVITNTVTRVASILENMRFYNRIEALSDIPGQRIFSPVRGGPFTVPLEEKLGLPISGMFTTPQVAEAIAVTEKNKTALNRLYESFILLPKVAIQAGKTVYSVSAQMRNFLSASLFYLGNGHIGGKNLVSAVSTLRDELFAGGFDTQGRPIPRRVQAEKTYRKLLQLGIINTNARLGEILKTFDEVAKDPSGDMGQVTARLIGFNGTKSFGRKIAGLPNKLYTAADDFWKIASFASERMRVKKKFTDQDLERLSNYAEHIGLKESVANKSYEDMLDEIAAYKVRQTIPNYDYVGNFANMIRRTPVGNFIAFPTEIVRTGFNIASLSIKDMTFSGMQGEGLRRGIGFGTATFGISTVAQAIGQSLSDVTDEELEAAKKFVGEWAKDSPLIPLEKIPESEGGGFTYVDGSYILVYDEIAKIIPTILTAAGEKNAEGASYPISVLHGMRTAIANILEPYIYLGIGPDLQRQILENRNDSGYEIANPEATLGDQAVSLLDYAWSRAQPGAWSQIQSVKQAAAADETSFKKYGKVQDTSIATLSLMGMRTDRVNPTDSFKYSVFNYQQRMRNAGYQFKDLVNDYGLVTPEDLIAGYDAANSSVFDIQRELYLDFLATQTLNGDQEQIKDQLKNRTSSIYRRFRKGEFSPYYTPQNSKNIYDGITEKMSDAMIQRYGLDTITKRNYPKEELKAREKFYRKGDFNLLFPLPPYED